MKKAKSVAVISLLVLASLIILIVANAASTQAQSTDVTVLIDSSIGGSSDPGAGTTSYPAGSTITLTATPDSGFQFEYWVYQGPDLSHYGPGQTDTTVPSVYYTNPMTFTCGSGYTVEWQPVFVPIGSAAVPSTSIPWVYIVAIAAIVAAVGVGAFLGGRRMKK